MSNRLVLSIGMPRAGSGWHYNLIHDLVVADGGLDARQVRRRFHLQPFLTEVNCNIGTLKLQRLLPVLLPVWLGNTYAVKTHAGPSKAVLPFIRGGRVVPIYIYRDPRAALLSAYEVGQRAQAQGRSNVFSQLTTLDKAGEFIHLYVQVWEQWMAINDLLVVRYEDLVQQYDQEAGRLLGFLGITTKTEGVGETLERYRPQRGETAQKGTHFSRGQVERFRRVFTPEQLEACTQSFAGLLQRMGYPL